MPEFLRELWVSEEAKKYWKPILSNISNAWLAYERSKINRLVYVDDTKLSELLKSNLDFRILERDNDKCRVFIGGNYEYVKRFYDAWAERNDIEIGKLLGYPDCCVKHFNSYWSRGYRDNTYFSFGNQGQIHSNLHHTFLRWLGIRLIHHLPCNINCTKSYELARKNFIDFGHPKIIDILHWPIKYTSHRGIAEIVTPVMKFITNSDMFVDLITIEKGGLSYPIFGAKGNSFPFTSRSDVGHTDIHSDVGHTDILDHKEQFLIESDNARVSLNGFDSLENETKAHDDIIEAIRVNPNIHTIVDLGCGDGTLMSRLAKLKFVVSGVESRIDLNKLALINNRGNQVFHNDLFKLNYGWFDLALISINRFKEYPDYINWLNTVATKFAYILIYSYSEDFNYSNLISEKLSETFKLVGERKTKTGTYTTWQSLKRSPKPLVSKT